MLFYLHWLRANRVNGALGERNQGCSSMYGFYKRQISHQLLGFGAKLGKHRLQPAGGPHGFCPAKASC